MGFRMHPASGSCRPPGCCSPGMCVCTRPGIFFPVPLARARPLLGNSRQRWGESCQARACRVLPSRLAQPASSAAARRPDSAAGTTGGSSPCSPCSPEEGARAAPARLVPASPELCGCWSGARGARLPWSSLLHESVLVEVVITPLLGSAVAAALSYAGQQLLPAPLIASETLTHPQPCVARGRGRNPSSGSVGLAGCCLHPSLCSSIPPLLAMPGGWMWCW